MPALWLVYAYKDLMQKINREPRWRSLLNILNSTEMLFDVARKFYNEYRNHYELNNDFEDRIRSESHGWLKEYLAKNFNPFLQSMGGWDDIHDYKSSVNFSASVSDSMGTLARTVGVAVAVAGVSALLKRSFSS